MSDGRMEILKIRDNSYIPNNQRNVFKYLVYPKAAATVQRNDEMSTICLAFSCTVIVIHLLFVKSISYGVFIHLLNLT